MSDTLIIPISAQVLVVPDSLQIQSLGSRLNNHQNTIVGKELQYDIDAFFKKPELTRDKGVHLHWRIPALLRHGITDKDNKDVTFPPAPNRWMVVRYQTDIDKDKTKAIPAKVWVVKSDVVNQGADNNWMHLQGNELAFCSAGETTSIDTAYIEVDGYDHVKLHAVAATNPFFSMVYDDSGRMFGLYDDMDGLAYDTQWSYVITGWYSSPEDDPLYPQTKVHKYIVSKVKSQWKGWTTSTTVSLFHHTIFGVQWRDNVKNGVPEGDVNVCLGQNHADALAAMVRHTYKVTGTNQELIESHINALMNNLLEDEKNQPSVEKLKDENHTRLFTPRNSGLRWEIVKKEQDNGASPDEKLPFFPQDEKLLPLLWSINDIQMSLNHDQAVLSGLQQEYYFACYHILGYESFEKQQSKRLNELEEQVAQLKTNISNHVSTVNQLQQAIQDQLLGNDATAGHYELQEISDHVYWHPSDPAVILYGDGVGTVEKPREDLNTDIMCQPSEFVFADLKIENYTYADIFVHDKEHVLIGSDRQSIIDQLVKNAIMTDPGMAVIIALQGDDQKEKNDAVIQERKNAIIRPAQSAFLKQFGDSHYSTYIQAWEPVFLAWKLTYSHEGDAGKSVVCKGLSPMTDSVYQHFKVLANDNKCGRFISQNLSGFHKFLLSMEPCLQLPPLLTDDIVKSIIDTHSMDVLDGSSEAYALAPLLNSFFSPYRKGSISIQHLSLIDGFGQEKTIIFDRSSKDIVLPIALGTKKKSEDLIQLPERIIQPCRLVWHWVSNSGQTLYQDTGKMAHPVLGWLVPNLLDNMLMVYNDKGHEIMGIRIINREKVKEYFGNESGEETLDPRFLTIINNLDIDHFLKIAYQKQKKITKRKYINQSAVSMMYGAPVAVATGRISFDILGQPINNPNEVDTRDLGNMNEATLSFSLGGLNKNDDGMIGYFLNGDAQMHTPDQPSYHAVDVMNPKDFSVIALINVDAGFHIGERDGKLPTQYVELFAHTIEELTQDIKISFLMCPFMSDKNKSYVPTPYTPESSWQWIHKSGVKVWEKPDAIQYTKPPHHFDYANQYFYEGWIKMHNIQKNKNN
jgi:hypothetical protein